jgi:AbrB family looped-hinge helix DNA binding protein
MRTDERQRRKASRVSETAPEYHPAMHVHDAVHFVTMADRGRLVLPADVRERLKIREGDRIAISIEPDGALTLLTHEVALDRLQGMYEHLAKPGRLASDELIAERRREARMEDREFRERMARLRRKTGR